MMENLFNKEQIKSFYRDHYVPWLPSNPGWRHWRIIDHRGRLVKLRQISQPEVLRKALIEHAPRAVYYTWAKYMDPRKISSKSNKQGYQLAHDMLVGGDLVFDVDVDSLPLSIDKLDAAKKTALKIYHLVSKTNELNYILFSGQKGFQLSFTDSPILPKALDKREAHLTAMRKLYILGLPKLNFDVDVTTNPRCIIRCPGTLHTKTGLISTILTPEQLKLPMKKLLNHIPHYGNRLAIPESIKSAGNEVQGNDRHRPRRRQDPIGQGVTNRTPACLYSIHGTNVVPGVKDSYVLLLKYKTWNEAIKDINKLRQVYKDIGYVYVLNDGEFSTALGVKVISRSRFEKILAQSKALNKNEFAKYGRCYFRISASLCDHGLEYHPTPTLQSVMHTQTTGDLSLAHVEYLIREQNVVDFPRTKGHMKGSANFIITKCVIKPKVK